MAWAPVIYNDIYDISCHDAEIIAKALGKEANYYLCGEFPQIIELCRAKSILPQALASHDVIEHIYKPKKFLKSLKDLTSGSLNIVMSSDANIFNPMIKWSRMKTQQKMEYSDRERQKGSKERDCLEAFYKIRKKIIQEYAENLPEEKKEKLALLTRGMDEIDIICCLDEYLSKGVMPKTPKHPTNTCDPYTGNWVEHLVDPGEYQDILLKAGFKTEVIRGFYGYFKNTGLRLFARSMDLMIRILRKQGIKLAPFYILYGKK